MISTQSVPKVALTADPRYSLLRTNAGHASGQNLGGKFALPPEFETNRFAAAFLREGQEVLSAQQDQPILGTDKVADGWQVWKYPGAPEGELEGKKKKKKDVVELKSGQPHPLGGQPHKVIGDKAGEVFVLMFRPIEIQNQVNALYGDLSREAMVREVRGETLQPEVNKPGMLTSQALASQERDAEADREFEEHGGGRSAAVNPDSIPAGSTRTRRSNITLHGG